MSKQQRFLWQIRFCNYARRYDCQWWKIQSKHYDNINNNPDDSNYCYKQSQDLYYTLYQNSWNTIQQQQWFTAIIFLFNQLWQETTTENDKIKILHKSIHCTANQDLLGFLWLAWYLINWPATNHDANVARMTPLMCRNGAVIYSSEDQHSTIHLRQQTDRYFTCRADYEQ